MHASGILYFPTESLYQLTPNSGQFEGVYQGAFTYNSENSTDAGSGIKRYLTVDLNQFRVDDDDHLDKRYNCIIVTGYIIGDNPTNNDAVKFTHSWVTDWNLIPPANDPVSANNGNDFDYSFEGETIAATWSPTNDWTNGASAVIGGQAWTIPASSGIKGWSSRSGNTSSGGTGPGGGVDINGNPPFSPASNLKYIYTEVSSGGNNYTFVCCTPPINFTTQMVDNVSNTLKLKFHAHGYGSQMGVLKVYISPNFPSNGGNSTELLQIGPAGTSGNDYDWSQTSVSSPYQEFDINLNAYKLTNVNHRIYFVYDDASGYQGDCAIDGVSIIETGPSFLNWDSQITQFNTTTGISSPVNGNQVTVTKPAGS